MIETLKKFIEDLKIFRRIALLFVGYITYESFHFCFEFASQHAPSVEVAAVIGAILTPVSALLTLTGKYYTESAKAEKDGS